ncbi:MAG: hypothetical protein FJ298_06450 [Planctomycetes bacterium]|nr:hypothetical protein [Planctomycetota bacterium]
MLDPTHELDAWYDALPRSPQDDGRVVRCVIRSGRGQRATRDSIEVRVGKGVTGDSWAVHVHSVPESEVSLINIHVARAVADGDESRTPLTGDNLQVDLDLSESNLPPGTLLEIGSAVLIVTAYPHRPCKSFIARFGELQTRRIARACRTGRRGRGVLCNVVREGALSVGDRIAVLRPAPSA